MSAPGSSSKTMRQCADFSSDAGDSSAHPNRAPLTPTRHAHWNTRAPRRPAKGTGPRLIGSHHGADEPAAQLVQASAGQRGRAYVHADGSFDAGKPGLSQAPGKAFGDARG